MPPILTALASAFSRQRLYLPATFSLAASHFSAGINAAAPVVQNAISAHTITKYDLLIGSPPD